MASELGEHDRPDPRRATTARGGAAASEPWPKRRGLRPATAIGLYAAIALTPIGLAAATGGLQAEPRLDVAGGALALTAFAMMLLEFMLSGRYRRVSGRLGIDRTLRFHRATAYVMVAMIALHPFLYSHPGARGGPWFTGADPELALGMGSLAAAVAAWILIAFLVLTALDRDLLPCRYETWHRLHAGGAVTAAGFVAVHAFTAGGHSGEPGLVAVWSVLLAVAGATLVVVHVVRPWRQRRAPYLVERVDKVGANTWEVRLRPAPGRAAHSALAFRPGQFAWLKLGNRVFGASEHPFSISTAPEEAPTIGFTIKESGDFTAGIGAWAPGTPAYLDGPHGHFVPDEAPVPTVYIAGGVGIGPVLGHLRAFAARGDPRPLTLIYGTSTSEQIPDRDELDSLARVLNLSIHYVVSQPDPAWQGRAGPITRDVLTACLPERDPAACRYFVCGPAGMMTAVNGALRELGVPGRRIVLGS